VTRGGTEHDHKDSQWVDPFGDKRRTLIGISHTDLTVQKIPPLSQWFGSDYKLQCGTHF
jgi:hypothetical protein